MNCPQCSRDIGTRKIYSGGICSRCYRRNHRTALGLPIRPTPEERLRSYIPNLADDVCWPWSGTIDHYGYGRIATATGVKKAHRLVYELLVGPIPDGLDLDHLCRNRACVNPTHLEPVTRAENSRRGMAPTVQLWRNGTCKRGHDMSETAYVRPDTGGRFCGVCASDRARGRAASA